MKFKIKQEKLQEMLESGEILEITKDNTQIFQVA